MEATADAAIVILARRIGKLEAEAAQLTADLALAHQLLDVRAAVIHELRCRLPVLEAAAGYERVVGVPI